MKLHYYYLLSDKLKFVGNPNSSCKYILLTACTCVWRQPISLAFPLNANLMWHPSDAGRISRGPGRRLGKVRVTQKKEVNICTNSRHPAKDQGWQQPDPGTLTKAKPEIFFTDFFFHQNVWISSAWGWVSSESRVCPLFRIIYCPAGEVEYVPTGRALGALEINLNHINTLRLGSA